MPQLKRVLIPRLRSALGEPKSELCFVNEYQLIVAVMLSAQSTDKKVNEVTISLFDSFPDFESLSKARVSSIEKLVRPINYYRTKAKNLKAMAKQVVADFHGSLPRSHEQLVQLPGVGNKTANVVRSELGAGYALPVDTHVFRVSKRLGLSQGKDVRKVEEDLKTAFPPTSWRALHHLLILHGRRVCKARRALCEDCVLSDVCPSSRESL